MTVWNTPRARGLFVAAGVVGLAACGILNRESGPEKPTDGNVAAMFLAANNTDVSYAKVALDSGRTSTPAVLAFASRMLADHSGLNQAAAEVFAKAKIVPEDNITSLDFRDESAAKRDTLRERRGAAFDSVYIANEVRYHTKLLLVLDSVLIPASKSADLKSLLTGVRPAVAAHLEHAERVQAGLRK
jgi:putative membrane protein